MKEKEKKKALLLRSEGSKKNISLYHFHYQIMNRSEVTLKQNTINPNEDLKTIQ